MKGGFEYPAAPAPVHGYLPVFEPYAVLGGGPLHERDGVLAVRDHLARVEPERAAGRPPGVRDRGYHGVRAAQVASVPGAELWLVPRYAIRQARADPGFVSLLPGVVRLANKPCMRMVRFSPPLVDAPKPPSMVTA